VGGAHKANIALAGRTIELYSIGKKEILLLGIAAGALPATLRTVQFFFQKYGGFENLVHR